MDSQIVAIFCLCDDMLKTLLIKKIANARYETMK